jgi:hypothetical protein
MIETEQERKTREYWANAYKGSGKNKNPIYDISSLDLSNHNGNSKLPYEPTAVLGQRNTRRFSVYDIANLNLSND